MAADRVQPVPWLLLVSTLGWGRNLGACPAWQRQSVTTMELSIWPPLMSTALAPILMSASPAAAASSAQLMVMPVSISASGRLGVSRSQPGIMRSLRASTASSRSRRLPLWLTETGSTTSGKLRSRRASARALMMPAENSMPVLAACTGKPSSTARSCSTTNSGSGAWMPVTPRPFWAVRAVMTLMP